ncbi:MAG: TOBE domain-containing protein [Vicinamibacterales bacterium]
MSGPLTVRAAAARLGVGYSTLKQWIYKGTVRTVTTSGGHHRIPESEVDRLLLSFSPEGPRQKAKGRTQGPRDHGVLVALSGRNQLRGVVEEVRGDGLLAQVRLRIGSQVLTAVITRDAVSELMLKRGDEAVAIIKSTEVMIGREGDEGKRPAFARRPVSRASARSRRSGPSAA